MAEAPEETSAGPPAAWSPPIEFEEYRLLRLLGQGGMGSVWLAEDRLLDRLVAVKWIAHAAPDARVRERFAIEARAAARLQHVNVVTVHRYGEVAGRPYLVSEYIRGESLEQLAKPIGWERSLDIGISLARGLAAAHRHGIVHRDIKPANAILTLDGDVKLVDFGLAKLDAAPAVAGAPAATAGVDGTLTRPGATPGTPRYLAPEVRRGDVASRRSDVYQIGCVLYELVTGRAPLLDMLGTPATTAGIEEPSALVRPPPVHELDAPSLSDRLGPAGARFAAVVDRCLARDPQDRFASGSELGAALELIRGAALTGALPAGNPYRGLAGFDAEHRAVFFGRGPEIRAVTERLASDPFVLVTGDSGTGKSSLCRAGVLPRMAERTRAGEPWTIVSVVPGVRPMITLTAALASALGLAEATLAALRDQPISFVRELRRARTTGSGIVVFVDQLEELVTIADRDEATAVAAVLAELAAGTPGLRLLATVRSDFLTRVAELPAIGAEIARAIYLLGPLSADGARQAIVGPASATGVRFESDELVDGLVGFVADADCERSVSALPLLAFTLAQLWEARDPATATISARSLAAIGGVRGALARHADRVLDSLLPHQRTAARTLLLQLVAPGRTRTRRSARELAGLDRAALDAVVRGRLVIARGTDEEPTYELAHEGLIDGWPTLAGWIDATAEVRAIQARLAIAVSDWERRQRAPDGLWSARQLADLAGLPSDQLTADQLTFVRAARRAVRRRRWLRGGLAAMIPLAVISVYVGAKLVARRDLEAHVAARLTDATQLLVRARAASDDNTRLRTAAFARFDAGETEPGETAWAAAGAQSLAARDLYAQASRALEAAFLLDTDDHDVRGELAELTYERLRLAEREYRSADQRELTTRLGLYDLSGALTRRLTAPGALMVAIEPADSTVALAADGPDGSNGAAPPTPVTPLTSVPLTPGTYILTAQAPGRATVRQPLLVRPGEPQRIELALPRADQVPPGFVLVPAGRFAFGSRDEEAIRAFFATAPMHEVATGAYLIGTTEVTYAQWIDFLEALPPDQRAARTPRIESSATVQAGGELELSRLADGAYQLRFSPGGVEYTARAGTPIIYRDRTTRASQDWRQFPVSGITAEDATAYTAWLDRSGRLPGARLCDEREWERAARGIDGRPFPHGDRLGPDDANVDVTYGQKDGGFGPDAVGSHPASTSVYGLADTSGNVWELTRAAAGDGHVMKGGCYYVHATDAHLANRQAIPSSFRHLHIGFRVCADAP